MAFIGSRALCSVLLLTSLLLTGLTSMISPAQAVQVEVVVTIKRIIQVQCPDDSIIDCPDPGDYFAKVNIGNRGLESTPHIDDQADISPSWTVRRTVDSIQGSIPIDIEVWDDDGGLRGGPDKMDVSSIDKVQEIRVMFDLNTASWRGNGIPLNQVFSQGDGDTGQVGINDGSAAKVYFDIAIGDGDTDDDTIPDRVELYGTQDDNGNRITDMVAGFDHGGPSDPCRKTIAVEIDFMDSPTVGHTHRPLREAMEQVVSAFNNAPGDFVPAVNLCPFLGFPSRSNGVNLVIDIDDGIPEQQFLNFGSGFETTKASRFDADRRPYFHYNIWAHSLNNGNPTTSGWGEGGPSSSVSFEAGNDFIVSLGGWSSNTGTVAEQAATFMHELGHNLGLGHGGTQYPQDSFNCKPNYISVMNYVFQTIGGIPIPPVDTNGDGIPDPTIDLNGDGTNDFSTRLDYASKMFDSNFNENSLSENAGLGPIVFGSTIGTDLTGWGTPVSGAISTQWDNESGPLDWDGDGFIDDEPTAPNPAVVAVDINNLNIRDCGPTPGQQNLYGTIDWMNIIYNFQSHPSYNDGTSFFSGVSELRAEDAQKIKDSLFAFLSRQNVTEELETVNVGNFPHNIAFNPSNNMMYVTNLNDDTVSVIDNITLTDTITVDDSPLDLAFNPSNERMYVTNYHQAIDPPPQPGTISVIDDTTITDTVNTDIGPNGIAFNPTNNMMYLVIQSANRVNVISGTTITDTVIPVGETPYKVAFNPTNNMMYVTNHLGDSVSLINGITNEVINTIPVGNGPVGLAFNSENQRMYVANFNDGTVSVIDGETVVDTIPVGNRSIGVAYNPSNNRIYVTNQGSNTVSVIDGETVVDTIPVGNQPIGVAYNPSNQKMYVVNSFSASISILDTPQ